MIQKLFILSILLVLSDILVAQGSYQNYMKSGKQKMNEGDFKKAIIDFTIALEIESTVEAYAARAEARYKNGDPEAALSDYDEAISLDSSNAILFNNRGNIEDELQKFEEALRDFDKALHLDSVYITAYYNRALTHYNSKSYEQAKKDFEKVFLEKPSDAEVMCGLGLCEIKLNNKEKACEWFTKARQILPEPATGLWDAHCK